MAVTTSSVMGGSHPKETIALDKLSLAEEKTTEVRQKNAAIPHIIEFGAFVEPEDSKEDWIWATQQWGFLKFQEGPSDEVGRNGLFIAEDLFPKLIEHLNNLNAVLPSRETALAITKLEESMFWLLERKRKREAVGIRCGTYHPHENYIRPEND
jgi:hypothetical protein